MALNFHQATLSNGLDIIAEENPDSHSLAAGLFVKTGARDETAKLNGVSHFLEHMMFKGSDRYQWDDVNRIFDDMGARYNAFTTQELTGYYANVLPEFTERVMEHLAELLRPAIRTSDFDTEKKVILEEIAMYLDEPGQRLYERLMETYFGEHPLSRSVLGTAESVKNLTRDEMTEYFMRRYGPGNMVLSVAGRLEFAQIKALAEKFMGAWKSVNAPRNYTAPTARAVRKELVDAKLNRRYVMGLTPGPSAQDDRRFGARVLGEVIGDSDGSRLYWALVDNAIAEDADFGIYPHDQCGSFYLSIVSEPARSKEAVDIAIKELKRVQSDLDSAEVERARNKIASGIVLSGESPMGRMRTIGSQWIYNREYRSLEQDTAVVAAVTVDSLRELMKTFLFEPMTIVSLGPG